jgi:AraC-like DNA-binding protein
MPGSGSSTLTDAEGYEASLRDLLDLVVLRPREFQTRLTWIDLPTIHLLRAQESAARVGLLRLPPNQVFVVLPARAESVLIAGGVELRFGDAMYHSLNERQHQRTTGACQWASLALSPAALLRYGRNIAGQDLAPPAAGQVLHLTARTRQTLLRLHQQATRVADTHSHSIAHPEAVRALEQDLIWALVAALADAKPQADQPSAHRAGDIMLRYETMLAAQPNGSLRMVDVCGALCISQHVLRESCSKVLGMGPSRYQRLRRLKLARVELMQGGSTSGNAGEVLARYGFSNFHRFVTDYWDVYGEMPPVPPRLGD